MTRPCCKCSRCGTTFLCTNGEMENGYCSQHVLDYLFPDICGQRTMTKGGKKKRPVPTASTAGTCLSVVNIGDAPMPKVPRHLPQVNCFQEGMLELDSPMGQCYSRFPTVSSGRRGEKRKKDTGLTRGVNPNSHIPHLQAQLAFAWHYRLV